MDQLVTIESARVYERIRFTWPNNRLIGKWFAVTFGVRSESSQAYEMPTSRISVLCQLTRYDFLDEW